MRRLFPLVIFYHKTTILTTCFAQSIKRCFSRLFRPCKTQQNCPCSISPLYRTKSWSKIKMLEFDYFNGENFLCPHRAQSKNASRFSLLCLRSAPKGGSCAIGADGFAVRGHESKIKALVQSAFGWIEWTRTTDPHLIRVVL